VAQQALSESRAPANVAVEDEANSPRADPEDSDDIVSDSESADDSDSVSLDDSADQILGNTAEQIMKEANAEIMQTRRFSEAFKVGWCCETCDFANNAVSNTSCEMCGGRRTDQKSEDTAYCLTDQYDGGDRCGDRKRLAVTSNAGDLITGASVLTATSRVFEEGSPSQKTSAQFREHIVSQWSKLFGAKSTKKNAEKSCSPPKSNKKAAKTNKKQQAANKFWDNYFDREVGHNAPAGRSPGAKPAAKRGGVVPRWKQKKLNIAHQRLGVSPSKNRAGTTGSPSKPDPNSRKNSIQYLDLIQQKQAVDAADAPKSNSLKATSLAGDLISGRQASVSAAHSQVRQKLEAEENLQQLAQKGGAKTNVRKAFSKKWFGMFETKETVKNEAASNEAASNGKPIKIVGHLPPGNEWAQTLAQQWLGGDDADGEQCTEKAKTAAAGP
jgi:hypothetical protein